MSHVELLQNWLEPPSCSEFRYQSQFLAPESASLLAAGSSPSSAALKQEKYSRENSKTWSGRCSSTDDMKSFRSCRNSGCCCRYSMCSLRISSSRSSNFSCRSMSFILPSTSYSVCSVEEAMITAVCGTNQQACKHNDTKAT
eukprot:TRINITY_DN77119_c0_g1_i1.p1 TRINITY_DN77119_c0_g1~~TRINITY_DN77119_c0_g1_i1.p1  ORF type:complete len:142 (-),score=12.97 TRINITY_DN77119_c0_g1_i1:18-443(-)